MKRKKNKYYCRGDVCFIVIDYPLEQTVYKCKIDREDLVRVKEWSWCVSYTGNKKRKVPFNFSRKTLHQFIFGRKEGLEIDHINRDVFDCRKSNLRHVTHQQNMTNLKPNRGVYYAKDRKKWRAEARKNDVKIALGAFQTKKEALVARRKWELENFTI